MPVFLLFPLQMSPTYSFSRSHTHTHTNTYTFLQTKKNAHFSQPGKIPKSVFMKQNLFAEHNNPDFFLICLDLIINNNYRNKTIGSLSQLKKKTKNSALNRLCRCRR
uniref:(northern house mosquito) hypothetical protein n=1 Tax=Culex pipiens TaxID=7175 RepID=A0A8D8NCT5_CULPI